MNILKTLSAATSVSLVGLLALVGEFAPAPVGAAGAGTSPVAVLGAPPAGPAVVGGPYFPVVIGADTNNATNPLVQPQNPALAGGGIDQSLQFFDLVHSDPNQISVLIGRLGEDILVGGNNIDFMIGGPEHFNPRNRDKAYGGAGDDVFIWSPGDGSDRFDGGVGEDTVIFGLIGQHDASGNVVFGVSTDQMAGDVALDSFGLPMVDVTNSPGFCNVIDASSSPTAAADLADIDAEQLVQFIVRGVNQSFLSGTQTTDNGLRVTLHLKSVEYLVCTSQAGGQIVAFDLRTAPPTPIAVSSLPFSVQFIID